MINNDLNILLSAPTNLEEDYFYKNTDGDEVIFIHKGTGTLRSFVGNIKFEYVINNIFKYFISPHNYSKIIFLMYLDPSLFI